MPHLRYLAAFLLSFSLCACQKETRQLEDRLVRDDAGRLTSVFDESGNQLAFAYHEGGGLATAALLNQHDELFLADKSASGRLTLLTTPAGDQIGLLVDDDGVVTQLRENGQLLFRRTASKRAIVTTTYEVQHEALEDAEGRLVKETLTGRNGTTGTLQAEVDYKKGGELERHKWTGLFDAEVSYAAGRATSLRLGKSVNVQLSLDEANRRMVWRDEVVATTVSFDEAGHLDSVDRRAGDQTERSVFHRGRLASRKTYGGAKIAYRYNESGALVEVRQRPGVHWSIVRTPKEGTTRVLRDGKEYASFGFDEQGRAQTVTEQGVSVSLVYDEKGLVSQVKEVGRTHTYGWDDRGRVVSVKSGPTNEVTAEYGPRGRLRRVAGSAEELLMETDARGRLSKMVYEGEAVTYGYTTNSELSQINWGKRHRLVFQRDILGNLVSVTTPAGTIEMQHDYNQLRTRRVYPNGVTSEVTYDAQGRMVSIEHRAADGSMILALKQNYTPSGLLGQVTQVAPKKRTTVTYHYDERRQLKFARYSDGREYAYSYDRYGNRLSARGPKGHGGFSKVSYDDQDRVQDVDGVPSRHDSAGNLLAVGSRSLQFDHNDRLIQAGATVYRYDALGLRREVTSDGERRRLIQAVARDPFVLAESGAQDRRYLWGDGQYFGHITGEGRAVYYLEDHLGSVRCAVDDKGEILGYADFSPFGVAISSLPDIAVGYAGQLKAREGLIQMGARDYAPRLGRFVSRDPVPARLLSPLIQNAYAYAANAPTSYIDRSGATPELVEEERRRRGIWRYLPSSWYLPARLAVPGRQDKDGNQVRPETWEEFKSAYNSMVLPGLAPVVAFAQDDLGLTTLAEFSKKRAKGKVKGQLVEHQVKKHAKRWSLDLRRVLREFFASQRVSHLHTAKVLMSYRRMAEAAGKTFARFGLVKDLVEVGMVAAYWGNARALFALTADEELLVEELKNSVVGSPQVGAIPRLLHQTLGTRFLWFLAGSCKGPSLSKSLDMLTMQLLGAKAGSGRRDQIRVDRSGRQSFSPEHLRQRQSLYEKKKAERLAKEATKREQERTPKKSTSSKKSAAPMNKTAPHSLPGKPLPSPASLETLERQWQTTVASAVEKEVATSEQVGGVLIRQDISNALPEECPNSLQGLRAETTVSLSALYIELQQFRDRWDTLPHRLRYPGQLARIHGFVVDENEVHLVGRTGDAKEPLIDVDYLILALRSVWKRGEVIGCSLDPFPFDISGPQYSRVLSIPKDSKAAKVMLDADYQMKHLMTFGAAKHGLSEYRSHSQILVQRSGGRLDRNVTGRFFLTPIALTPSNACLSSNKRRVLFDAGVQVMTEEMVMTTGGLIGSGSSEPSYEEAAEEFTRHYDKFEAKNFKDGPVFRELHCLFDTVAMAAFMRRVGLSHQVLDDLSALPTRKTEVPDFYPGVTHSIPGTTIVMSGGVDAKVRIRWRLLNRRQSQSADEATTKAHAASRDMEKQLLIASRSLSAGKYAASRKLLLEMVQQAPNDPDVVGQLVLAEIGLGNLATARQLLAKARAREPRDPVLISISSNLEVLESGASRAEELPLNLAVSYIRKSRHLKRLGLHQAAVKEAEVAVRAASNSSDAYIVLAEALIGAGEHKRALRQLLNSRRILRERLKKVDDPFVKKALARVLVLSVMARVPITSSVEDKRMTRAKANAYLMGLEAARKDAEEAHVLHPGDPAVLVASINLRWTKANILEVLGSGGRLKGALGVADQLAAAHPTLATGHGYRALILFEMKRFKEAKLAVSTALSRDSDCGLALIIKGRLFRRSGNCKRAIEYLGRGGRIETAWRGLVAEEMQACKAQ